MAPVVLFHSMLGLRPAVRQAAQTAWQDSVSRSGARAQVFTYPRAGHFYTDASLQDHDEHASELTWQRVEDFLRALPR